MASIEGIGTSWYIRRMSIERHNSPNRESLSFDSICHDWVYKQHTLKMERARTSIGVFMKLLRNPLYRDFFA